MPASVMTAGTGRPHTSINSRSPGFARAFATFSSCGLKIPSRRPLVWALSPATDFPSVSASSSANPSRRVTTAAHRVSTGARLIAIVSAATAGLPSRAATSSG
jgi:hypothetical protein